MIITYDSDSDKDNTNKPLYCSVISELFCVNNVNQMRIIVNNSG